jgi:hypothetical protein
MVCVGSVLRVLSNGQEPALKVGAPELLGAVQSYFWDVAHDGQRFLVNGEGADVHPVVPSATVVINWLSSSTKQCEERPYCRP